MEMYSFAQVNKCAMLDLGLILRAEFQASRVDYAEISDVILPFDRANHELRFPKLLVIGKMIMTRLSIPNLKHGFVSVESNLDIS